MIPDDDPLKEAIGGDTKWWTDVPLDPFDAVAGVKKGAGRTHRVRDGW